MQLARAAALASLALASVGCILLRSYDDYSGLGSGASSSAGGGDAGPCDPANVGSDPNNCGACGHDCLGGGCLSGVCQPVPIFENDPNIGGIGTFGPIELSGDQIFFADVGDEGAIGQTGAVWRARTDGTGAARLDAPATTEPVGLALSTATVFWTSQEGVVRMVGKSGGAVSDLVTGGVSLHGIAAQIGALYYVESLRVRRFDLVSAVAIDIATGLANPDRIAVDGEFAYVTLQGSSPSFTDGSVVRVPLDGGAAPAALASNMAHPTPIAIDDARVFWATIDGSLWSAPKDGTGEAAVIFAGAGPDDINPKTIAVDGDDLVWTAWGACLNASGCGGVPLHGRVSRIPKVGGVRGILAEGAFLPTGIAVDATAIYFTTWWFASVVRLAK